MDIDSLLADLRGRHPAAGLTADSRKVRPGDIFLAFPGDVHDGRHYAAAAVAAGAAAVLWDAEGHAWPTELAVENHAIAGLREQAPALAAAWWNHPSQPLWLVGITGTNGKTSCSHWLADCFTRLGRKTAVIGTLGNGFPGQLQGSSHTTPDAVTLQALLASYRDDGARGVAMEVSSHALDQGRVAGVSFDVAMLTNLTRDHLDYHGDMAAYAQAKARLFAWRDLKCAVLNEDDEFGRGLRGDCRRQGAEVLGYGLAAGDIRGTSVEIGQFGLRLAITTPWGRGELEAPLIGRFNAHNLLGCLAVLLASDIALDDALSVLRGIQPVAGRMQRVGVYGKGPLVIVDYAHTPDALEKTLTALRDLTSGRLVCVFGCGGGRDRGKRPLMGEVAAALADAVVVTSDNPRHEDPATIVADILAGMPAGQTVLLDRGEAIAQAIVKAARDDVVLIAGKGHETYQEVGGERRPFSDAEEALRALAQRKEPSDALA